jgi:hypothetical protein
MFFPLGFAPLQRCYQCVWMPCLGSLKVQCTGRSPLPHCDSSASLQLPTVECIPTGEPGKPRTAQAIHVFFKPSCGVAVCSNIELIQCQYHYFKLSSYTTFKQLSHKERNTHNATTHIHTSTCTHKHAFCTLLLFFFFFLQYWGLNSGPSSWAIPPAHLLFL